MAKKSKECSGKFMLRMAKSLHAELKKEAEYEGISLNQLCLIKLAMQLKRQKEKKDV